jgi:hypothetical protein
VPLPIILTFSPYGTKKTLSFMKWLGIAFPRWLENDLQFTTFGPADLTAVPGFDFSQIGPALARTALGLFRLNSDLFGWPSSFALIVLGLPVVAGRRTRVLWAMFGSFLLLMLFQSDWGIDSFGPVHAFEVSLPILCLTIVSARNLERASRVGRRCPSAAVDMVGIRAVPARVVDDHGVAGLRADTAGRRAPACQARERGTARTGASRTASCGRFRDVAVRAGVRRRPGTLRHLPSGQRSRSPQRRPVGESRQRRGGPTSARDPARPHRLRHAVGAGMHRDAPAARGPVAGDFPPGASRIMRGLP